MWTYVQFCFIMVIKYLCDSRKGWTVNMALIREMTKVSQTNAFKLGCICEISSMNGFFLSLRKIMINNIKRTLRMILVTCISEHYKKIILTSNTRRNGVDFSHKKSDTLSCYSLSGIRHSKISLSEKNTHTRYQFNSLQTPINTNNPINL